MSDIIAALMAVLGDLVSLDAFVLAMAGLGVLGAVGLFKLVVMRR